MRPKRVRRRRLRRPGLADPPRLRRHRPRSPTRTTPPTARPNSPPPHGIATARALARCYAALIGAVDGDPRLFAPATLTLARTEESAGPDRILVVNTRFGLGFMLHGPASPLLAPGSFGHPGRGGALAFADPESGIAFGYVTNGMQKQVTADPRAQALAGAVSDVVG